MQRTLSSRKSTAVVRKHGIYLCLQATREGQASHAHVHEILGGLRHLGWNIELFEPAFAKRTGDVSMVRRLLDFMYIQLRLMWKLPWADVLYVRFHPATLPSVILARIMRIPVIQEVNGPFKDVYIAYPEMLRFAPLLNRLMRTTLKLAKAVIVVTPQLASWLRQEIGEKSIHVIPNGANAELFHPHANTPYEPPKNRVVYVSAMARWHGVQEILQAAQCEQWPRDLSLVLVGDGVERPAVEQAAQQNTHIVYLGKIPYQDVPGVVAGSVAGLVTITDPSGRSATGLSPIKLYETMACGVPVIVTDFPGQADLVREVGCGIVVPPGNPEAIAAAVARIYREPNLRDEMCSLGRTAIEQSHSWKVRAASTDHLLHNVVHRGAA